MNVRYWLCLLALLVQMHVANAATTILNSFGGNFGDGFFQIWGNPFASAYVVTPGGETIAELRLASDDLGQEIGLSGLYAVEEGDEISFRWAVDYSESPDSTNVNSVISIGILFDPDTGDALDDPFVFISLVPVTESVMFQETSATMTARGLLYLDIHLYLDAGSFSQPTVLRLDDLVLTRASAVPVPPGFVLLPSAMLCMLALAKRRNAKRYA